MIYTTGQRVRHSRGQLGTVTRDTEDHGHPFVCWDGTDEEIQIPPECIEPLVKPAQSIKNAWTQPERVRAR